MSEPRTFDEWEASDEAKWLAMRDPGGYVATWWQKRYDDLVAENERLRAENAAFREAFRTGDGPSCEDVCLTECLGPCEVGDE